MSDCINNSNTILLLNSLGVSNFAINLLMEEFKNITDIWTCRKDRLDKIKGLRSSVKGRIINGRNVEFLKRTLEKLDKLEVRILTIYDEEYPAKLKNINDRPNILYIKGRPLSDDFSLAVVGSRKTTDYGRWVCKKFTKELAGLKIGIVSGLAMGIDAYAHSQALESQTYTVAVLGNGIDKVYPAKNKELYEWVERGGSIVTEFPMGTPPLAYNFPQRNRIISGLSDGVIVVEAKEKSGSLITAHHALEQGKDVFAVPGNIDSIFSSGTNKLIKDGAIPLLNIEDILYENNYLLEKLKILKEEKLDLSNFSSTEKLILKLIKDRPMHSDNIVYETGINISSINTILIGLELKGAIEEVGNNVYITL